ADLVRRDVVVLDIARDEAARQRARGLVAVFLQPLAVRLQLLAGVDRRQRRRNPPGLERVRRVGARADLMEAELPARLDDRRANLVALFVRAPDLETRRTRHAVTQRPHRTSLDLDRVHVEELDLRHGTAVEL